MSWNKKIKERVRKNRLKACVIMAFLVFLSLSLYSYHPQDSSLNFAGLSLKVNNYCGFFGASLADWIYQFFGFFGAWLIVLGGLGLVYSLLIKPLNENHLSSFLLLLIFLFSSVSLAELHFPLVFFKEEVSLGGVFGSGIVLSLKPLFGAIGAGVILWSAFLVFFVFYGQFLYPLFFRFPKQLFISVFIFFRKQIFLFKLLLKIKPRVFLKLVKAAALEALKKIKKSLKSFFSIFRAQAKERDKSLKSAFEPNVDKKEDSLLKSSLNESFQPVREDVSSLEFNGLEKQTSAESFSNKESKPFQDKSFDKPAELSSSSLKKNFWTWQIPPFDLLLGPPPSSKKISSQDVEELSKKLLDKLKQFSIEGQIKAVKTGPALVLFEYKPENHVKVNQIKNMESDLSLALSSESVRIIAPIPGRDVVGIEASMPYREMVYLKDLIQEKDFSKSALPLVLGRRADNKIGIKDLARIPHLLVAGTTGSGKSMFIISFISSLLFRHSPESLKFLLVDPKQVDLSSFKGIPHLLSPIVHSAVLAVQALHWSIQEMEKRYRSLAEFQVRDHKSFNQAVKNLSSREKNFHEKKNQEMDPEDAYYFEPLPLICIVIEEFGDLMADFTVRRSIENAVVRLAQKARASGIHLVLAMQSPRKDVLTGLIKTNIPGRISFKVASGTDSRVILDETGAERLLSHGDMLFLEPGSLKPARYHGPFIRDKEVSAVADYWRELSSESFYEEDLMNSLNEKDSQSAQKSKSSIKQDPMYAEILNFVRSCKVISASLLQRKFQIGYPRAGRIIQDLFEKGEIGPPRGSKPREVLIRK